ncbi:MAG: M15 family metallopeptidase [Oscillospiraceae bacterium]
MRFKSRVLLSVIIVCLSMVLFVSYYLNASVREASVATTVRPSNSSSEAESQLSVQKVLDEFSKTSSTAPCEISDKTEEWSLILVNGQHAIPQPYDFYPSFYDTEAVDSRIFDLLVAMMKSAEKNGISLWIASGFRDVETQTAILENAVENRMNEYEMDRDTAMTNALKTIALPGYSEHHTGLAVDFNTVSVDFEETEAYHWLSKYAAEYGFVQRYPEEKEEITGINYEPWHYRYVGKTHAREMKEKNYCLEEYIAYLKTV